MKMKLEQKVKQLGINRVLVADDRTENLIMAVKYFETLKSIGIEADFAGSEKQAIEKLEENARKNSYYDLVLSDMQMEDKKSGLNVARCGFKNLAFSFIVTTGCGHNGRTTEIEPRVGTISGAKSEDGVWEQVLEKSLESLTGEGAENLAEVYKSFRRYKEFIGKPSDRIAETMMWSYIELE